MGAMYNTSDKIVKNLSYIESASVSFNIPDTITITVVDATPSYVIPNGKGYLLVSSKGRILEEISENKDKLPELTCGDIKTKEVGQYVSFSDANVPDILEDVSQSLINNKVKNITGFDVTDTANIKLVYDGRIDINIGLPDDIDYKIRTAMTIINEKLDPNKTGAIYGTLDVSSCSTTKTSRFNPNETIAVTTAPVGTTIASQATDNTSPAVTTPHATLATNSNGNYVGSIPATGTDIGNGIVAFDTDGDGIAECFDTDGDGYADVYGSLNSSGSNGSDNSSDSYSDGSDGYNSGEPSEDYSTQYDDPNNSYL